MLVLSRRESEKILFPSLGISIEVVKVQGRKTRLGINAPANIPVLRHECAVKKCSTGRNSFDGKAVEFTSDLFQTNQQLSELMHIIRNRLSLAANTLNQLNRSMDDSNADDSQQFMMELFQELQTLEAEANSVLEASGVLINNPAQALLVEDGDSERQLLEGFLEVSGFEVIIAKDGQDALDYLSMHSKPDVVLLDMMMPRINGPDFVREVRSNDALDGLSIFAVSGLSEAEVAETYGVVEVDRWITKPFSPKNLVFEIAEHLTDKALIV